jgi:NhaP-type Na+/H+ or K+/H+ antiporter
MRVRQALNVEAGLNDGLSVPFLMFFMAMAISATGSASHEASLMQFIVEQLGYGALVGVGIGLFGGYLLSRASRREWMAHSFVKLAVVALPLLCLIVSVFVGASMFIASFACGLAIQAVYPDAGKHSVEFSEEWGQLLNLSVFFLFGILITQNLDQFRISHAVYAILSLTVIRMLPVAIALAGAGLSRSTILFMGWFGPRGLASIVLGLVYLEHQRAHMPDEPTIRLAVMMTVGLSIFAHGLSANPCIDRYTRRLPLTPREADAEEVSRTED